MKLLDFLPGIAQKTSARFKDVIDQLESELPSADVYYDTYLIVYSCSKAGRPYYCISEYIEDAFRYVSHHGKDCQVMLLQIDFKKPVVKKLF